MTESGARPWTMITSPMEMPFVSMSGDLRMVTPAGSPRDLRLAAGVDVLAGSRVELPPEAAAAAVHRDRALHRRHDVAARQHVEPRRRKCALVVAEPHHVLVEEDGHRKFDGAHRRAVAGAEDDAVSAAEAHRAG